MGVPGSGAADPLSLALANRLVGNAWDEAALEATLMGPILRFTEACPFAIAGARAVATLNGAVIAAHETVFARAGDKLALGAAEQGVRSYIAVAGGFIATQILGSCSTYLPARLGGFSGRALQQGDELGIKPASVKKLLTPDEFRLPMPSGWALRASASFEFDLLSEQSRERLFNNNWVVGRRADRTGMQLEGPALEVRSDGRMQSAPVFPGTVQCPESGSPYVLSVDAGTVGGYPRVAQVVRADRHLLGQLRPGEHVRLLWREQRTAAEELRAKHDYWRAWLPEIESII